MDAGAIAILALAGVLVLLPAPLDRWALRHGASPETLIALATITLTGIAAVPVAFLICTSHPAGGHASSPADSVIAVTGVLLVAIAAGRALGRAFAIGTGILLAICLSIHSTSIWLGIAACTLLIASIYTFTRPALITARATSPATPTGAAGRQPAAPQAGGRDNAAPARARSHALSPRHR